MVSSFVLPGILLTSGCLRARFHGGGDRRFGPDDDGGVLAHILGGLKDLFLVGRLKG